ncbi:hypothetical protein BASA82_000012 [Batrachochytrium salamandrivorans]|nr:hypothetical protein BASA82_000012 [Batrachochytrium salamandrivorans]
MIFEQLVKVRAKNYLIGLPQNHHSFTFRHGKSKSGSPSASFLEVATRALQRLFLRTFAVKFPSSPLPYDQVLLPLLRTVNRDQREMLKKEVTLWDITLDEALTQAKLCDPREIALIKNPPIDVEREREAKQAAVALKEEGNRAFRALRFEEAYEFYSQGILLGGLIDPIMLSDFYGNRSSTQLKLDKVKEAVIDAQSAVRVSPLYHKSHHRLALAHYANNDLTSAVASLEQVLGFCHDGEKAQFRSLLNEWREEKGRADRREDMNLNYAGHQSKAEREKLVAQYGGNVDMIPDLGKLMQALPKSAGSMNGYLEFHAASQLMRENK